jgi:hypothetical protein
MVITDKVGNVLGDGLNGFKVIRMRFRKKTAEEGD